MVVVSAHRVSSFHGGGRFSEPVIHAASSVQPAAWAVAEHRLGVGEIDNSRPRCSWTTDRRTIRRSGIVNI
jgi:hypothetical protein